ncbi:MAG: alpha/beta fold hydrolase [Anaerolineaceae bacterium]|nr:alpha/beta fold hydrolase [Anaerolineaceae bacterium]
MIWDYENLLARRLILWAILCILVGAGLLIFGAALWRGFGLSALSWGVIDALLASTILEKVEAHLGQRSTFHLEDSEAVRLRKILWRSNALDVLYVAAGTALLFFLDSGLPFWHGFGWGVILQGVYLFAFDLYHALHVPDPLQMPALPWFTDPRHAPFTLEGGQAAAILVHGFPGTALEMQQIGESLNQAGWTVRGVRLPGFGPELVELINHNNRDWVAFIQSQIEELKAAGHSPILLVGYSFGGGLALQVAAEEPVDGLALLAPFTWQEPRAMTPILNTARALLPVSIDPFKYVPITHPLMMEELFQYLPEIDPHDPDQQAELRLIKIPLYILDQLREVGREALNAAPQVQTPTLIIHGSKDDFIRPPAIKHLRGIMPAPIRLETVEGPHSLTMPHNPALADVLDLVVNFGNEILESSAQD